MRVAMNAMLDKTMGSPDCRPCAINGVVFVAIFSLAAGAVAGLPPVQDAGLSAMVVALLLGAFYSNTLRNSIPEEWVPGIVFSAKKVLRIAIVLYGLRVSLQEIMTLGVEGIAFAATMLASTMVVGVVLGRLLGMDRDTATLVSSGASVCGASAVLSVEGALGSSPYKAAVAVATVVIFGTLMMFLLPVVYTHGALGLSDHAFAIYAGAITHEVAQVAAIASFLPPEAASSAVLAKMARVLMLAPLLLVITAWVSYSARTDSSGEGSSKGLLKSIPWYAFGFLAMVGVNSAGILPQGATQVLTDIDTFLLVMAMTAIGMETTVAKVKKAGATPFKLGLLLAVWLFGGGYLLAKMMLM